MNVDKLLREGKALLDAGNVAEAILKWQQALVYEPNNVDARELLGRARSLQESSGPVDRTVNLGSFTKLLDAENIRRQIDEKLREGMALLAQGRLSEAIPILETVRDIAPDRPEIQQVLDKARADYSREENIDSDYFQGKEFMLAGNYSQAMTKFLQVLASNDKHALARAALEEAKAALAKPGSHKPASPDAPQERAKDLFRRGVDAYKANQLQEAIDLWEEVIRLDPAHPRAAKYLEKAKASLVAAGQKEAQPPVIVHKEMSKAPAIPAAFQEASPFEASPKFQPSPAAEPIAGEFSFDAPTQTWEKDDDAPTQIWTDAQPAFSGQFSFDSPPSTPAPAAPVAPVQPVSSPKEQFGGSARNSSDPFAAAVSGKDGFDFSLPGSTPAEEGAFNFDAPTATFPASDSFSFDAPPPPAAAKPLAPELDGDAFTFGEVSSAPAEEEPAAEDPGISFSAADFLSQVKDFSTAGGQAAPTWFNNGEAPEPAVLASTEPSFVDDAEETFESLFLAGRASMGASQYEEAVDQLQRAVELEPQNEDASALLEKAKYCFKARDELASALSQAELSLASDQWDAAVKSAEKLLQLNPFLQRAEQILADARPRVTAAASPSIANPTSPKPAAPPRSALVSQPKPRSNTPDVIINPFASPRSSARLAPAAIQSNKKSGWRLSALLILLVTGGIGGYLYWAQEQQIEQEKLEAQQKEDARKASQKKQAQECLAQAQEAILSNELVKARDQLRKATQLNPQVKAYSANLDKVQSKIDQIVYPNLNQAQLFLEKSHYEEAITEAQKALLVDPVHPKATMVLSTAQQYLKLKDKPEEKIFRQNNFNKFVERGDQAMKIRQYELAREMYEVAFSLNPKSDIITDRIARAAEKVAELKEIKSREQTFVEDIEKDIKQGKLTEASEKTQRLLDAIPESAIALNLKGKIYAEVDRLNKIEMYKKQANQYYKMNNNEMALTLFEKWLELDPTSKEAKFYVNQLSKRSAGQ